ncbi:NAD-dependent epimerase/dehydratase family protein [Lysobacter sp. K5869]|uniref:NAD-dependent epimerase/dehydratase family protein n=1 Tax=Lysobacter sp. K5869 TaxID=2820808 RepID=UPI001C061261|nr:NAD-dependent epimerase/dehydratase family protein [Lysobacter sp. K5869]QWP76610.1 NAD-dependent epimerase/dehydratase family protein [Lysobacter sp. K5869]
MTIDRRDFLAAGAAAASLLALPGGALAAAKPKSLKLLVLGGTGFLGPHFVEAARKRGHTLTLFNRGKTNPDKFSGEDYRDIEQLHGDRKTDMSALQGERTWDAVLDTSAYIPADVTRSAKLLAPKVKQYLLVSTISVYAKNDVPADENSPVAVLADPTVDKVSNETYGGLKALCEKAAEAELPGRTTVVRPGLIVGPGDNSDRFTYWPARADRGGEILAPGSAQDPTQFIDVRDLAAFLLTTLERGHVGTYNADAEPGALTMGAVLRESQKASGKKSTTTWASADFLEAQKVSAWGDMPAWVPARGENAGFGRTSVSKARAAGLTYRPLRETVRDTLAWWRKLPEERRAKPKAGLSAQREGEVLAAWHAQAQQEKKGG